MKLVDLSVSEFTGLLGSDAPAPGGGSASSLVGALGAGLTSMVCALTAGKKKYAEYQEIAERALAKNEELRKEFLELIDRDTLAFNEFSAALLLPRETEEEKGIRKVLMQSALKKATQTPMEMMRLAAEALRWVEALLGKSNQNAVSDLGVAAICLKTAIQGAWLNVLINVGSIEDEAFVREYTEEGKELLERAVPLADRLYEEIAALL